MLNSWRLHVLPLLAILIPALGMAQISLSVSVNTPPPELPVYEQPPIPGDGYVWTPGYWAWADDVQDYYWVPGTWVPAPQPDYLWTPGYWGLAGAAFLWHPGYWGPHVGFYGGVNYGYGYGGRGYDGGYWQGGRLYYNRSVNNINNVNVTNVYNRTVVNNVTVNRVSYNGGNGIHAQPDAEQAAAAHDRHIEATPVQQEHIQAARNNSSLHLSENNGRPPIPATSRPGNFTSGSPANHPQPQPQQQRQQEQRVQHQPQTATAPPQGRPPAPPAQQPVRPAPAPPQSAQHPQEHAAARQEEHEHH